MTMLEASFACVPKALMNLTAATILMIVSLTVVEGMVTVETGLPVSHAIVTKATKESNAIQKSMSVSIICVFKLWEVIRKEYTIEMMLIFCPDS
jgi:hypothetical protein